MGSPVFSSFGPAPLTFSSVPSSRFFSSFCFDSSCLLCPDCCTPSSCFRKSPFLLLLDLLSSCLVSQPCYLSKLRPTPQLIRVRLLFLPVYTQVLGKLELNIRHLYPLHPLASGVGSSFSDFLSSLLTLNSCLASHVSHYYLCFLTSGFSWVGPTCRAPLPSGYLDRFGPGVL